MLFEPERHEVLKNSPWGITGYYGGMMRNTRILKGVGEKLAPDNRTVS